MGDYADDIADRAMNAWLDEVLPPRYGGKSMVDADYEGDWPFPPRRTGRPGLSSEREHIRRERAKLDKREWELLAAANRFGAEPPVGTVITFAKRFPDRERDLRGHSRADKTYNYAALRVGPERAIGAGWFLTGRDGKQPRDWAWICDFIGDGPFRVIAPESGKAKFFNVLVDDRAPSNMVLVVDECGRTRVGVDPAMGSGDWADVARATRKAGLTTDLSPVKVKRPGDEFPSYEVPGPGESGYDAEKFEAATRAKHALEPFYIQRVVETINSADTWVVRDRRQEGDSAGSVGAVVAGFLADKNGEARARQSAMDRNKSVREEILKLNAEPPVGARVRSKSNPRRWARRDANGWTRYNGITVQAVRLDWTTVRGQLTQNSTWQSIEPGTFKSGDLFG